MKKRTSQKLNEFIQSNQWPSSRERKVKYKVNTEETESDIKWTMIKKTEKIVTDELKVEIFRRNWPNTKQKNDYQLLESHDEKKTFFSFLAG